MKKPKKELPKTKEELERECERMRTLDAWYGVLVVTGAVIVVVGMLIFDSLTMALLGTVPAIIAIFFVAPRIHCPYCGGNIRMKFGLPNSCPHCGGQLSEKK